MKPILTVTDVAALLDCTDETVEIQTRAGKLPGVKYGRNWVYPAEALLTVLNKQAMAEHAERAGPAPEPQGAAVPVSVPQAGRRAANSSRIRPRPDLGEMPALPAVAGRN